MNLTFQKFQNSEAEELIDFLVSQSWPFHEQKSITKEQVQKNLEKGFYSSPEVETFWILNEENQKIGFIRVFDLDDGTPLFDLRIKEEYQGKGIGTQSLHFLCQHILNTYPHVRRIEGYTREDNMGMRKVFEKCGFLQEAQHRSSWPGENNDWYDSIGYGLLRSEYDSPKS